MAGQPTERLVVGLIRGLHGLRGVVRVEILTDDPDRFAVGSVLHLEGETGPLTVTWCQPDGPGLLVRFREVPSREVADALRERYLEVVAARDALPDGAYYWHEVQGARVTTTDGRDLGTVQDIFRVGEGEVFVVDGGAWGEVMVPAVSAVVREFAPADGRVVVDADSLGLDDAPPVRRPRGRRTTRAARAGTLGPPGDTPAGEVAAEPAEPATPDPA